MCKTRIGGSRLPMETSALRANHSNEVEISPSIKTLGIREQFRDEYWLKKDPILKDRLRWRAHTFRHLVHLLPGQTILELGAGHGLFTQQILRATREENPITSVTFVSEESRPSN